MWKYWRGLLQTTTKSTSSGVSARTMKTIYEVKIPFTCIFRRWLIGKDGPVEVEADTPICIVAYRIRPGVTTDIKAGAEGRLHREEWIKEGSGLEIGTTIAILHLSIPV